MMIVTHDLHYTAKLLCGCFAITTTPLVSSNLEYTKHDIKLVFTQQEVVTDLA